ncbi:MAG TPA: energy transducer TonB, partial [Steroidobacteraceae bacterium]|nr:energy transducer TonB [Steroidobacteraceae bacterium]
APPRRVTPPRPAATAPAAASAPFPAWTPEPPAQDEFAEIAAQARFGVQQRAADEAARRRRQRVFTACGIAVVVAGCIVFLIEKFYDPEARARERAIAAEVARMAEQQKLTDDLTLIEIDIENAIMNDDLDRARAELSTLIEKAPEHPRREFLQASIDRAAELARLSPQTRGENEKGSGERSAQAPVQAAVLAGERTSPRARNTERAPESAPARVVTRTPERRPPPARPSTETAAGSRSFGAPINEARREPVIPLDAPINAPPTFTARRSDNSFPGRTVEASDSGVGRTPPPPVTQPAPTSMLPAPANASGSATAPMPSAAPAAKPTPPAPVDVVPAKLVKRVLPVAPSGISRRTNGHVVVTYNIGVNGRVSDVQVVESEPQGVFDESALDAVRRWVYEPRKENGVAVEQPGRARLVFDSSAN